ncbi:MAG: hypothetical protein WBE11_15620, partial [Candidatus Aminicenantaceae bacterium]
KRDKFQAEKRILESKRIFLSPQQVNLNMFELSIHSFDGRNMVWPACGITIPLQYLLEGISDRNVNPYLVDVQYGILADIYPKSLHDPLTVVFSFCLCFELDQCRDFRFMEEKKTNIR